MKIIGLTVAVTLFSLSTPGYAQNSTQRQIEIDSARMMGLSALNALDVQQDYLRHAEEGKLQLTPQQLRDGRLHHERNSKYWSDWVQGLPK
jgi:hypothetical protein